MTSRAACLTLVALVYVATVSMTSRAQSSAPDMLGAAQTFLGTLDAVQAGQAQFPFDAAERFTWFYTPVARKGLPLKSMTPRQQDAALNLLRAGLSETGYGKAETIRQLELVLFDMEGAARRDPGLYYISIFGEPSDTGTWGWRYEGHHISQHWMLEGGRVRATTPQFFGANPAEVRQGQRMQGTRALAGEADRGWALLRSLDASQRAEAVVGDIAPADILTTNDRRATEQSDVGVAYAALDASQQAGMLAVIEEYANAHPAAVAQDRMRRLRNAGLENMRFAWMGGAEPGDRHYYRIQGPTFLIEYDNTQNDGNHIHAVWRDFDGDFGLDVLAAHYHAFPHARTAE